MQVVAVAYKLEKRVSWMNGSGGCRSRIGAVMMGAYLPSVRIRSWFPSGCRKVWVMAIR